MSQQSRLSLGSIDSFCLPNTQEFIDLTDSENSQVISYDICLIFLKKVPLVAENKAEINPIILRLMMIYAFQGLIGFWYFEVFSIDWARYYCRDIVINGFNINFRMS